MDTSESVPVAPRMPSPVPASQLTREDWVKIYGEAVVHRHSLTPVERWRQSMATWDRLIASGVRLDDDDLADLDAAQDGGDGAPDGWHNGHRPSVG